jgi:deoxyribodipyrimidine photolyase-related protein
MKSVLILYPNQLYPAKNLPQVDTVMMVEEPMFFGVDQELPMRMHKQKLILLRAAMRRYAEEVLWPTGVDVDYVDLDVLMKTGEVFDRLKKFERILIFDPVDEVLTRRLLQARRERPDVPAVEFLPSPNFYLKDQEVRQYFTERHKQPFAEFYQWQRERFNVLIGDDYKPVGGKWIFDDAKVSKLPANTLPPSFAAFGSNKWVEDATKYVTEHFPNNPGSVDFIWPTNHVEAHAWLADFVDKRLADFSRYAEALDAKATWMWLEPKSGAAQPTRSYSSGAGPSCKGTVAPRKPRGIYSACLGMARI